MRSGVRILVACVEVGEAGVHIAIGHLARIWESHVGETLRDGQDLVMYALSPDRLTTAAGSAIPNSMRQDAEDGYLVFHGRKKGVQAELGGERDPVVGLETILGGGTLARDGQTCRRRCRLVVSRESHAGSRCSICQGCVWGATELRKARRASLDRSKRRDATSAK